MKTLIYNGPEPTLTPVPVEKVLDLLEHQLKILDSLTQSVLLIPEGAKITKADLK